MPEKAFSEKGRQLNSESVGLKSDNILFFVEGFGVLDAKEAFEMISTGDILVFVQSQPGGDGFGDEGEAAEAPLIGSPAVGLSRVRSRVPFLVK